MKKISLLLLWLLIAGICKAQMSPRQDRNRGEVATRQQQPRYNRVQRFIYNDLALKNATNAPQLYIVSYTDASKNYHVSFASGQIDKLRVNENCTVEIISGTYTLEKNHHYELYFDTATHKVLIRALFYWEIDQGEG